MSKRKMQLDEIRVSSFVVTDRKPRDIQGGRTGRACQPHTYFWYICTVGTTCDSEVGC